MASIHQRSWHDPQMSQEDREVMIEVLREQASRGVPLCPPMVEQEWRRLLVVPVKKPHRTVTR